MDSNRQKRIGRLLQKDLGDMFQREVRELLMGSMVSVTAVRVTADLSIARIYLSIFPGNKKDEVFNNIVQNKSHIRYLLGKRVGKQLRVIPDLEFFIDDSLDYLEKIDRLLKE